MTRWLETDSGSNVNISAATEIGSYTADADRLIMPQVLVDQVAGNGDYILYATLQVNGSGSAYRLIPITTAAVASGVTAIGAVSTWIPVRNGDIVKVYVDGLAGDTTTPDPVVRWFELAALRPTTADRTLAVDGSGLIELTAGGVDAVHDDVLEGTLTFRQAIRIMYAVLAGESTGGGTSTIKFRDLADTKDRVSASVDMDGNRTAVTVDGS